MPVPKYTLNNITPGPPTKFSYTEIATGDLIVRNGPFPDDQVMSPKMEAMQLLLLGILLLLKVVMQVQHLYMAQMPLLLGLLKLKTQIKILIWGMV